MCFTCNPNPDNKCNLITKQCCGHRMECLICTADVSFLAKELSFGLGSLCSLPNTRNSGGGGRDRNCPGLSPRVRTPSFLIIVIAIIIIICIIMMLVQCCYYSKGEKGGSRSSSGSRRHSAFLPSFRSRLFRPVAVANAQFPVMHARPPRPPRPYR